MGDNSFLDYESYLVGRLCIDGDQIFRDVYSNVTEEDFQSQDARTVFLACSKLVESKQDVNPVAIMEQAKLMGRALAPTFLKECMNIAPTNNNVVLYSMKIHEEAEKRRISNVLSSVSDELIAGRKTLDEAVSDVEQAFSRVCYADDGIITGEEALNSAIQEMEARASGKVKEISTGFRTLDRCFNGGLENGLLYVFGARPASGKTTLGVAIANAIALQNRRVLFISLEMTTSQLSRIRMQMLEYINADDFINFNSQRTQDKVNRSADLIKKYPIDFNKAKYLSIGFIFKLCRSRHYDAVIIDYLQLITPKDGKKSRYEEITAISRGLKGLALELNIPVVCLSQLNRGSALDRPKMSDLRDSGSIEQDADIVGLLYVSDRAEEFEDRPSTLEINIAKNRFGAVTTAKFDFYMNTRTIKERNYK